MPFVGCEIQWRFPAVFLNVRVREQRQEQLQDFVMTVIRLVRHILQVKLNAIFQCRMIHTQFQYREMYRCERWLLHSRLAG